MPRTRTQLGLQDLSNVKQEDVVVKQEDQKDFKLLHSVKQEPEVKLEAESDGVKQERPDVKPLLDSNGNPYWDLGRSRRLFVSKFKGVEYVHIREFVSNTNTGEKPTTKMMMKLTLNFF